MGYAFPVTMRHFIAFPMLFLLLLAGCSGTCAVGYTSPEPEIPAETKNGNQIAKLGIPPGHLPPPGSCRIWVPGVPPGRQSRADACGDEALVPLGGWLVTRPAHDPDYVEVEFFDEHRPGLVVDVQWFEVKTGRPTGNKLARGGKPAP